MAQVLYTFAVVVAAFGVLFMVWGRVGERGYWTQRDPQEHPGDDDTGLGQVARNMWDNAMHGKRPSLRIMGVGWIMVVLGVAFAVLGFLASFK